MRAAKLLLVVVLIGTLGRGSAKVWPLLSWPMYHDRGETALPAELSEIEVRALDATGAVVGVLTTADVFGFERVPAGSFYLTRTFVDDGVGDDERHDRVRFLARRVTDIDRTGEIADIDEVEILEAWLVTWTVDVGEVPPLRRDEPIAERRLGTYPLTAGAPAS